MARNKYQPDNNDRFSTMDRVNWVNRVDGTWVDWNWVNGDSMHWSWVNWRRVGWLVSWRWVGNTIVLDISNVAAIAINISRVVHNLDAAIRKGHLVLASYNVGVGSLLLVKAGTRVVIVDAVLERVGFGRLCIASMDWLVNGHGGDW